jgi:hypothetical protein
MTRLSLSDDTPRDAVDDAVSSMGLFLVNILPRTDAYPAQAVYLTPDRRALVYYIDAGPGARALLVHTVVDLAAEERWAAALRGALGAGGAT